MSNLGRIVSFIRRRPFVASLAFCLLIPLFLQAQPIFQHGFEGDPLIIPPDPADDAPDVETHSNTTVFESTEFLYTQPDPIQTGVDPGTIKTELVAMLRGRVLDRAGDPLPGVNISVRVQGV